MKVKELLSPEYQRRYDKAFRDWEAGKNLRESVAIVYGAQSKKALEALVKLREKEVAEKRKKGAKLAIAGLGRLTHNGVDYVCKKKTLLYPKSSVPVDVDPELASEDTLGQLWRSFCLREQSLVRELEAAIAKYYRKMRQRPSLASIEPLPVLKRNSDIWDTLGKPEISFRRYRREVVLQLAWHPNWEDEHGLYVYLSPDARIRHVGEIN
jgi:hypothetical protein